MRLAMPEADSIAMMPYFTSSARPKVRMTKYSAGSGDYSPRLREIYQSRVAAWLVDCLGLVLQEAQQLAGVLLMAFDGIAMNVHPAHGMECTKDTVALFAGLIASSTGKASTPA
jgi:hypothetical protein